MASRKKTAPRRSAAVALRVPDTVALLEALEAHALGRHEMTTSQVNVALSLLKLYAAQVAQEPEKEEATRHEDALEQLA